MDVFTTRIVMSLSLALFVFAIIVATETCCRTLAGLFRKLSVRLFFSPRAACSGFLKSPTKFRQKDSKERQEREAACCEKSWQELDGGRQTASAAIAAHCVTSPVNFRRFDEEIFRSNRSSLRPEICIFSISDSAATGQTECCKAWSRPINHRRRKSVH